MLVKMPTWRNACAFSSMSACGAGDEGRNKLERVELPLPAPCAPMPAQHPTGEMRLVFHLHPAGGSYEKEKGFFKDPECEDGKAGRVSSVHTGGSSLCFTGIPSTQPAVVVVVGVLLSGNFNERIGHT